MTTFNLNKFVKKAFNDDGRGLMLGLSRSWMNAYRSKLNDGMNPQEAWFSCLEEFQKDSGKDWTLNHAAHGDKK
jgi:hypothetical protein